MKNFHGRNWGGDSPKSPPGHLPTLDIRQPHLEVLNILGTKDFPVLGNKLPSHPQRIARYHDVGFLYNFLGHLFSEITLDKSSDSFAVRKKKGHPKNIEFGRVGCYHDFSAKVHLNFANGELFENTFFLSEYAAKEEVHLDFTIRPLLQNFLEMLHGDRFRTPFRKCGGEIKFYGFRRNGGKRKQCDRKHQ